MNGHNIWFYDLNSEKINFVNELKKLDVVILKPNYVNFMRFSSSRDKNDPNRFYATKKGNIMFRKNDLSFETYNQWVYNQIDKNKKYIAIGLDQGAHFVKYFCNEYYEKCIALFILTDRILTKQNYEKTFHSETNYEFIKSIVRFMGKIYN